MFLLYTFFCNVLRNWNEFRQGYIKTLNSNFLFSFCKYTRFVIFDATKYSALKNIIYFDINTLNVFSVIS